MKHKETPCVRISNQDNRPIQPAWFPAFFVRDRQSNLTLVAYQYLRSIHACILDRPPAEPCNQANHGQRHPGSGALRCRNTRRGALDKIYQPGLLGAYATAAAGALAPIPDDGMPLKVACNHLYKMPNQSGSVAGTLVE